MHERLLLSIAPEQKSTSRQNTGWHHYLLDFAHLYLILSLYTLQFVFVTKNVKKYSLVVVFYLIIMVIKNVIFFLHILGHAKTLCCLISNMRVH